MAETKTDLQRAFDGLNGKQKHHNLRWAYYLGEHPLKWSVDRLREVFKDQAVAFVENWCAVVIDSVVDRLQLERFNVTDDEQAGTDLNTILDVTNLKLDVYDIHLEAAIVGESFVIAGRDEDGGIEAYHNDARCVHVFYDDKRPHVKAFAAKWWQSAGMSYLTLYYPDRFEYYASSKALDKMTTFKAGDWMRDEDAATDGEAKNELGVIPVFHFRFNKRGMSELDNAIPLQDVVNKALSDMMVAGEFASAPQRWAITHAEFENGKIPYSPYSTIKFPPNDDGQATQVGVFPAADLSQFLKIIDSKATAMGIITRTPKHYFYGQAGDPSGEALIAMEAPLNKKCGRYIERVSGPWRSLGRFLLELAGKTVDPMKVQTIFADVRTVQPLTQAQIRQTNVTAGIPIINQLRDEGWSDDEIRQLLEDMGQLGEATATPADLANSADAQTAKVAANMEAKVGEVLDLMTTGFTDRLLKSGALDKVLAAKAN